MTFRVIVNGALGKMGAMACDTLEKHPDFSLVAKLSKNDNLRASIAKTKAQVVVDLTRADAAFDNSIAIIESGAHPVIGTSGLLPEQIAFLRALCEKNRLGGIIAPNFSIGAILMMRFAAKAAHYLNHVEIIEIHHEKKYDAPSGTALKTAELIANERQVSPPTLDVKELIPGARGADHVNIPIHSLRLPGVIANQQVIFGGVGETLTIQHNSIDRSCFMPGIVLCCQKVLELDHLIYGLEHIL